MMIAQDYDANILNSVTNFECAAGGKLDILHQFKVNFYRRHNVSTPINLSVETTVTDFKCALAFCEHQCQTTKALIAHLKEHIISILVLSHLSIFGESLRLSLLSEHYSLFYTQIWMMRSKRYKPLQRSSQTSQTQFFYILEETLQSLGVETSENFHFNQEADLLSVLRPIQARQLVAAWKEPGIYFN